MINSKLKKILTQFEFSKVLLCFYRNCLKINIPLPLFQLLCWWVSLKKLNVRQFLIRRKFRRSDLCPSWRWRNFLRRISSEEAQTQLLRNDEILHDRVNVCNIFHNLLLLIVSQFEIRRSDVKLSNECGKCADRWKFSEIHFISQSSFQLRQSMQQAMSMHEGKLRTGKIFWNFVLSRSLKSSDFHSDLRQWRAGLLQSLLRGMSNREKLRKF